MELDAGEREAILLALELPADLVIPDDREARSVAVRQDLEITGTLGVLERADDVGLLADFEQTSADLQASGFYLSTRLRNAALDRHRRRRAQSAHP